ncbi:MAG TPA: porin family protein [Chitinophagaceae bacterium]|nr:porin family protein [Chitinophagaceae bacterium]
MKKSLLSIVLLFNGYFCFSQVSFGIKSGINIATTKNVIAFPENRVGWYSGVASSIPLQRKFYLQPELIYSSKGDKTDNQGGTMVIVRRLNYINFPLLIGYHFDQKTAVVFGPEFGYLVGARLIIGENNLNDIERTPPRFDIGASVGLHYKLLRHFESEIRYIYGFNTLYSVDAVGNRYTEKNGANRVFQIGLRYVINP